MNTLSLVKQQSQSLLLLFICEVLQKTSWFLMCNFSVKEGFGCRDQKIKVRLDTDWRLLSRLKLEGGMSDWTRWLRPSSSSVISSHVWASPLDFVTRLVSV